MPCSKASTGSVEIDSLRGFENNGNGTPIHSECLLEHYI